jgi:hypothetical protein
MHVAGSGSERDAVTEESFQPVHLDETEHISSNITNVDSTCVPSHAWDYHSFCSHAIVLAGWVNWAFHMIEL